MEPKQHNYSIPNQVHDTIDRVLNQLYPSLFNALHLLLQTIRKEEMEDVDEVLNSYFTWLQNAIDDLYRKEKIMLFPKINQIYTDPRGNHHQPALAWVYQAHKDILLHLHHTKMYVLNQGIQHGKVYCETPIYKALQHIEKDVLMLQLQVEEHILLPFENTYQ